MSRGHITSSDSLDVVNILHPLVFSGVVCFVLTPCETQSRLSEFIKGGVLHWKPLIEGGARTELIGFKQLKSRGIALLFLEHGTRRGWGVSVTPRPLFTPGKDPVPIVQEAGWAPGPVWTGAENFARTGIWSPDRPARSQSLYRLRYPTHFQTISRIKYKIIV